MMATECKDCGSKDLAKRGNGFRTRCQTCQNIYQKANYHRNHDRSIEVRKALYRKHADKRREESKIRKADNREHYSLLEWFRKKGIPASHIPREDFAALVEMKKALTESKRITNPNLLNP